MCKLGIVLFALSLSFTQIAAKFSVDATDELLVCVLVDK